MVTDTTALVRQMREALQQTLLFCETFSNRWDGHTGAHPFGMVERARRALVARELLAQPPAQAGPTDLPDLAHKGDAAGTTNTTDPIVQTHSAQAEIDRLKKANEGQTRMNVTLVMENAELIRERETLKAKLAACMKALTG